MCVCVYVYCTSDEFVFVCLCLFVLVLDDNDGYYVMCMSQGGARHFLVLSQSDSPYLLWYFSIFELINIRLNVTLLCVIIRKLVTIATRTLNVFRTKRRNV